MQGDKKEVFFDQFCATCKHTEEDELDTESVCYECIGTPFNQDLHKPIAWEKQDEKLPSEKNRK